jgi:PAS domain S-box-containing protein
MHDINSADSADLERRNKELRAELRELQRLNAGLRAENAQQEQVSATRLHDAQQHLSLLIDSVIDYAIFMLDRDGTIVSWNSGAKRIKGYEPGEIIGSHFSRFYTEADRAAGLPSHALEQAARDGKYEMEGWRVRKDGSVFWATVIISAVRDNKKRADRLCQNHARLDRAALHRTAAAPSAKNGGRGTAYRRCRSRFQQSADRRHGKHRDGKAPTT